MNQSSIVTALIVILIAWRLYVRIRRMVGRQKSRVWRHWIAAILFPLIAVMVALPALARPDALGALAAGIVVGAALAVFGLRTTKFETTPLSYYYTPNTHLGIGLSLLMVARIAYRVYEVNVMTGAARSTHMQDFARSPLTLAIFGTLAAYYTTYAIGILLWRARTPLPGAVPDEIPTPASTP
ncbi:MAG TPA: hypothetical protein VN598_15920 [Usitatibacter sp.]|nr:hypothetical protein [Usitatibacter sp.]